MLTTREAVALSGVLTTRVPERRSELDSLIDEPDLRKRSPFYFGLTAYGRDFQGIESYVEARLSQASDPVKNAVLFMAFAYYYGQISLSPQTFGPVLGIPASKLITMSKVVPDYVRELLVEADVGVRPAHYLIAEEILHQELGATGSDWRNWRVELADLAIKFIDLLADLPHRSRGATSDILRSVLIERGSAESPAGSWGTDFSLLLEDIPNVDGRRRVLEHLTDTLPDEPHFWAHLGRSTAERIEIMKRRIPLTRQHLDCYRMILCYTTWLAWGGVPNSTVCWIQIAATSAVKSKPRYSG